MDKRRERQLVLALVSVIIALGLMLYFFLVVVLVNTANNPKAPRPVSETRPEACAQYMVKHAKYQWDPVTETYPVNPRWMKCMGVERRM